jgi:hypothetical protein
MFCNSRKRTPMNLHVTSHATLNTLAVTLQPHGSDSCNQQRAVFKTEWRGALRPRVGFSKSYINHRSMWTKGSFMNLRYSYTLNFRNVFVCLLFYTISFQQVLHFILSFKQS